MTRSAFVLSFLSLLFIPSGPAVHAEPDSARVMRYFMYASSGEVRYRDLVEPGKDSIIAMGETGARWLVTKLDATDARERLTLAQIFEKLGSVATPYLIPYLDSSGEYMPKNAARCIGGIKDTSATLALVDHLNHQDYSVRSEIATALGKIADPRASQPLESRLRDDIDSDVRKSCVVALGNIGDSTSADVLLNALADQFFGVRQSAIEALGKLNPPPCAALLAMSASAEPISRHGAIVALGYCHDAISHQHLSKLMKDPAPQVRGFAVEAFAMDTTEAVQKAIAGSLDSEPDPFVRAQIERAIRNSQGNN